MPPKVRVTKEMILDKAFAMTRENGFESVTARGLAEELACSTQPIFRVYENMESLRVDLYARSLEFFAKNMCDVISKSTQEIKKTDKRDPVFLGMGMTYLELAKRETYLFRLLCAGVETDEVRVGSIYDFAETQTEYTLFEDLPGMGKVPQEKKRELFLMEWIFTHGLAAMTANNGVELSETEQRELLVKAYHAMEQA
ncbi:MAG TPA: TetR/AcrR family transcriptional regulator [Lachnospiraceae bacterium]|jgi:AcrR family transcriptional regulator|nr:TetR/AcrR family transcriptional regulator [Lachnospiraceae bacterium]